MKYFTPYWWAAGCEDRAPIEAYQAEFARIRAALPLGIVELEEHHTLHDARVEEVRCEFEKGGVTLRLAGWNRSFSQPAFYTLNFLGVTAFEQGLPPGRGSHPELGDLGYWEYEIRPGGVEMRILFASSAEFRIVFRTFSFSASGPTSRAE